MAHDRTVLVRLKAEVGDFISGMGTAAAAVKGLSHEINTTNERTAWMAQGFLALAPALVPIGAVAIPAITTLATQFGLAAAAAGVGIMAFHGVGSALDALNKYQLDPSATNLTKMQQAMDKIGPSGAEFVHFIDSLQPKLAALQNAARDGLFPGIERGIQSMQSRLPEVQTLISDIAGAMGQLAGEAGAGLAGHGFDDFFNFLEQRARPLLVEMGHTIGNFIEGLAHMASAFEPLTVTFSHGFLSMSQSFSDWAAGLSDTKSFQDFVSYAQDSLPKVGAFLESVINLFVQLAQAAAPVGDVMLPALTTLVNVIAKLADTPLGTIFIALAAGVSLYGRAVALASITTGDSVGTLLRYDAGLISITRNALRAVPSLEAFRAAAAGAVTGLGNQVAREQVGIGSFIRGMAPAAAAVGLLGVAMSDLDNKAGLTNTTMGALTGLMIGGPVGAGLGALAGLAADAAAGNDDFTKSLDRVHAAMVQSPTDFHAQAAALDAARKSAEAYKASVTDLSGNPLDVLKREFGSPSGFFKSLSPSSIKNSIEDLFGGSEVQDQAKNLADASAAVQNYQQSWSGLVNALKNNNDPFARTKDYTKNLGQLAKYATSIQPALDALNLKVTDLGPSSFNYQKNVDAIQAWLKAQDSIPGRTHAVGSAILGLGDQLLSTADSATALSTALDALFGPTLDKEAAIDAAITALHTMKTTLDGNTKTFAGNTKAALENRAATRDAFKAQVDALSARAKAGASTKEMVTALQQSREGFIREGIAAGFSRTQMEARANAMGLTPKLIQTIVKMVGLDKSQAQLRSLVKEIHALPTKVQTELKANGYELTKRQIDLLKKQYDLTPKEVKTLLEAKDHASALLKDVQGKADHLDKTEAKPKVTLQGMGTLNSLLRDLNAHLNAIDGLHPSPKVSVETDAANAAISGVLGHLGLLHDKYINVNVHTTYTHSGGGSSATNDTTMAHGGIIDFYASGGLRENHVAQIAPAGAMRVWAEPETGGEAYIPLAMAKRDRSRSIATEVVARLGGRAFFANGGMWGQGSGSAPVVNASVSLSDRDISRLATAVREATRDGSRAGVADGAAGRVKAAYAARRVG